MSAKRSVIVSVLLIGGLSSLAGCANSPLGQTVQRSLAADPRLEESPVVLGGAAATPESSGEALPTPVAELPSNFPAEIPRYPGAELVAVSPSPDPSVAPDATGPTGTTDATGTTGATGATAPDSAQTNTQWQTTDSPEQVAQFYQRQFQDNAWEVIPAAAGANAAGRQTLVAERDGLRIAVEIPGDGASGAATGSSTGTEFAIAYGLGAAPAAPSPLATAGRVLAPSTQGREPSLASSGERSPRPTSSPATGSSASGSSSPGTAAPGTAGAFRDLNQAPEELRSYIEALARLGVLSVSASSGNGNAAGEFKPNQPVTRREFARWLVATNNRLFSDRPADKIRLGDSSDQPAFSDVPRTDPDFAAIQGLADAGLIPSALAGEPSATSFRPNAPLTREDLILWKTPLDTRQTLPTGSVDVVRQTWGFQDAARIDPRALRAVQADFGNGDLSNIRRAFGYTTLFQPKKPVTRAEAAATLWYFGYQGEGISAQDALAN